MAVRAEPHLLEDDFVVVELAIGLGVGEFGVGVGFGEALVEELLFQLRGDAADAGELAFGMGEFIVEEKCGVHESISDLSVTCTIGVSGRFCVGGGALVADGIGVSLRGEIAGVV